jgi:RNA polymerase sigma factor (sigma-70 family)
VPPFEVDEQVRRAQQGDTAAFAELFRQHRSTVARIAFRMLGPGADLEDVVQEVFFQVFRSLPDFRGQSKFSTWLHRVAVNVVLMVRRRARSRPVLMAEETAKQEPSAELQPDQELMLARRLTTFRKLLDRLSEKKRTVFLLHEIEGMSPAEIAELVDCPVLTVRTRLFYARRDLVEMMRSEPDLAPYVEHLTELGSAQNKRGEEPSPASDREPQDQEGAGADSPPEAS